MAAARDEGARGSGPPPRARPQPGFFVVAGQLMALRFRMLGRRRGLVGWLGLALSVLVLLSVAGAMGAGGYLLFARMSILVESRIWMAFFLALYFFLLGVFWILWPLVAAQVDDAAELGRFLHYPVRPGRLYLVQTLVGLFEPSALFFYPALVGAGLGLGESLRPGALATVGLMVLFAVMCVALGRALLNGFLNVMVHRRAAELFFTAFLLALGLAAVLPPVDTSWLTERMADLASAEPEDLGPIVTAAGAMTDTPPGWIAHGLRAAARGFTGTAIRTALGMLVLAVLAWGLGLLALLRFYRGRRLLWRRALRRTRKEAGAEEPSSSSVRANASSALGAKSKGRASGGWSLGRARGGWSLGRASGGWSVGRASGAWSLGRASGGWSLPGIPEPVAALCERELRTLWRSPKGRLLFAMPFFLLILLKLVGAAPLFAYWLGPAWASQLLTALAVYVMASLAGQFFVNQFGYDGQAVRLLFLLPQPPRAWFLGRNLAHGLFASGQFAALTVILFALLPGASASGLELPLVLFPVGTLLLLGVGNLLSVWYPRRYVFTLKRRDRPAPASFGWLLGALGLILAAVVGALGLSALAGLPAVVSLALLLVLSALVYGRLLPLAEAEVRRRREALVVGVIEG